MFIYRKMLTWVHSEVVAKCNSISVGRRRPPRRLLGVGVMGITLLISEALSQESRWRPGHRVRLGCPCGGTEEQRRQSAGWKTGHRDTQPGTAANTVSFGHIFGPRRLWETVTLAETTSVVFPAWHSRTTTDSVRLGMPSVLRTRRSGSIFLVLLLGSRYRRSLDLLAPAPSLLQSRARDPR